MNGSTYVGDFIEVVYCAKHVKLFGLSSEQKMRQTRLIPWGFIVASIPFLICLFIPSVVGSAGGTLFAILVAGSVGTIMRLERICCCDDLWQKCKNNETVKSVASEITTLTNDPELQVPSGTDPEDSDDAYDHENDVLNYAANNSEDEANI